SNDHRVQSLGFIELGNISIPSCLVYLENDVLYVGSSKGDSQVVHVLGRDSIENKDILQVIETFPSLGPVIDFCVADLDKQGQLQLITCSGAGKDSSLRIIRSGVGLNQLAAIEMSGVKATWALRSSFNEKHTDILIISFVNATQLLQIQDNTIVPLPHYSAITPHERTLMAGNVINDMILQVTEHSVRLMTSHAHGHLLDEWRSQQPITIASMNPTQCVISLGFGRLVAFSLLQDGHIRVIGERQLTRDISCLDITPIDAPFLSSSVIAVGVWHQVGVLLLQLDNGLVTVADEPLAGMIMPRSILMTRLEGMCYLLVGLADGQTYNFRLGGSGRLWDKKRSFLGKLPIVLGTFSSNGMTHVFAASDKPTVIHSRNQKLVYSNVNLKEVRHVTSFNNPFFPDAVALTTREGVVIGQMEEIQKLHITKIPTLDTPRRIIYQETSHTFGVITEKMTSEPYTSQSTTGGFEVLDEQNFTVLDRIYFKQYERPLSALSTKFDQDDNEYYIVATGRDSDAFETASSGRILVLQLQRQQQQHSTVGKRLALVTQIRTSGMVEQLGSFKGKLIASVHGKLEVYEWDPSKSQLELTCSHSLPSITESLATHGDYILTGDMLASVTVLRYDGTALEEVGADEAVREVTALAALSDTLTLGAERDGHLFVVERESAASVVLEDPLLETVSEWHLGELVQRFQFGALGNVDPSTNNSPMLTTLIFATVNGAIGVIADLSEDRFKLLLHMQNNMTKVIKTIGDLSHADWRSVCTMDRNEESSHFIDGDLIEGFLDLTPQQMQQVVDGYNGGKKLDYSIEDLCKVVEELMSLHS
ncbi:CPSF A subunit region-domain-containing protein, partial [Chlamydoabsidia padenii]